MKDKTIVCNIGHFDNEIAVAWLKKPRQHPVEIKPQVDKYTINGKDILLPKVVGKTWLRTAPKFCDEQQFYHQTLAQIELWKMAKLWNEVYMLPKHLMKSCETSPWENRGWTYRAYWNKPNIG